MIEFTLKHPRMTFEMLGYIPHGGGWKPFQGFRVTDRGLEYAGDPPMRLLAEARLREEVIRYYESSWVSITQPDGSVEISRMD